MITVFAHQEGEAHIIDVVSATDNCHLLRIQTDDPETSAELARAALSGLLSSISGSKVAESAFEEIKRYFSLSEEAGEDVEGDSASDSPDETLTEGAKV